ncbi:Sf6 protein [Stenotrophomonas phage C121]|uniref:Sf6 protein n=1 Tax=Stenotrophomonas phage C121 TaxID=2914029 RepID=UPI0023293F66|nr:Sf6 protein [Stenotrophomonas phage C121]UKL14828.1 Sf6 protein [Stenotrophomonas phage C121]
MIEKVTFAEVNEAVYFEKYEVLADGRTTVCLLTLDNDFTVTGVSSTVDQAHFVKELGEQAAKADALNKVWMLLAFRKFEEANR